MANPEHLKILEQGVESWNDWRNLSPMTIPDLSQTEIHKTAQKINLTGADLTGTKFVECGLQKADFHRAKLSASEFFKVRLDKTNFRSADLSNASFNRSRLIDANLTHTNMTWATFKKTALDNADFDGAGLINADFSDAVFRNTNLSNCWIMHTKFIQNDLSEVRGLETVHHGGPSEISVSTLYLSRGDIPEKFLRGCGVPDGFITYMRSLVGKAIEFYSCFISYSNKDEEFAKRLYSDLQSEGVRCWFAQEDLKIGEKFRVRIDESIRLYDKLLLVLSESSVTSQWVEKEVETAFEKEDEQKKAVLFPVRLDDAVMDEKTGWAADVRKSRHVGDFRDWKNHDSYRKAFERLMRDLKAEASR